jgi:hypothetical protein
MNRGQAKLSEFRNSANGRMKGYKERGRSRGEATDGCDRAKGWEERIFRNPFRRPLQEAHKIKNFS